MRGNAVVLEAVKHNMESVSWLSVRHIFRKFFFANENMMMTEIT